MNDQDVQDGVKRTLKIEDENFYLVVGETFAQVTVPRENDPLMSKTRMIAETICSEITIELEKIAERRKEVARIAAVAKVERTVCTGVGDTKKGAINYKKLWDDMMACGDK